MRQPAPAVDRRATVEALLARYRELAGDWRAFVEASCEPLPTCVWAHPERIDASRLRELLEEEGVPARPSPWDDNALWLPPECTVGRLWPWLAGLYVVQEQAAMLPVRMLDPCPGERVLDLCAAPGNKTAQIALAVGSRGTVVANDKKAGRMAAVVDAIARLGLRNVTCTTGDGATYPASAGGFDKVLVDAPCTAEGNVRKTLPQRADRDGFRQWVVGTQRALLRRAAALCRPGGRIVYSTCTFAPEENEHVVDAVLRELEGELRVVPDELPGLDTAAGVLEWQGVRVDGSLRHAARLWPHVHDTGGFFAVALERVGGEPAGEATPEPVRCEPATEDGVLGALLARHGIATGRLDGIGLLRHGRYARLVAADHRPPSGVRRVVTGMPVYRDGVRAPKLSHAAALAFGRHATAAYVDIGRAQVGAFVRGDSFVPSPDRLRSVPDGDSVLVRYGGVPLGTARARTTGAGPVMVSELPKALRR